MKRITAQERFKRLKEKIKKDAMHNFFNYYLEMKDIEQDLIKDEEDKLRKYKEE